MKRGNNATENLRGTRMHISIDQWGLHTDWGSVGLHDCFHREQVYKKPLEIISSTVYQNAVRLSFCYFAECGL